MKNLSSKSIRLNNLKTVRNHPNFDYKLKRLTLIEDAWLIKNIHLHANCERQIMIEKMNKQVEVNGFKNWRVLKEVISLIA